MDVLVNIDNVTVVVVPSKPDSWYEQIEEAVKELHDYHFVKLKNTEPWPKTHSEKLKEARQLREAEERASRDTG